MLMSRGKRKPPSSILGLGNGGLIMSLMRKTTMIENEEAVCHCCDTIHDEWFEHKTNQIGSSRLYVECDCVPKVIFQEAYLLPKPDHHVWMRKWIHCKTCMNSWFEEAGEESTCTCNN